MVKLLATTVTDSCTVESIVGRVISGKLFTLFLGYGFCFGWFPLFLMLSALLPLVAKVVFLVCHYHLVIEILHLVCEVVWT